MVPISGTYFIVLNFKSMENFKKLFKNKQLVGWYMGYRTHSLLSILFTNNSSLIRNKVQFLNQIIFTTTCMSKTVKYNLYLCVLV